MKSKYIQYYVEGENEAKLVKTLKGKMNLILPGKVAKLNVIEQLISDAHLRPLLPGTMVVLIFDTDTKNVTKLNQNILKLKEYSSISEIITIPQVRNLEDELVRSCNIKNITELLNSTSLSNFKSDFIQVTNLDSKLNEHDFNIQHFWNTSPCKPYQKIKNTAFKIKK